MIQSSGLGFIKRTRFPANRTVALTEFPQFWVEGPGRERHVSSLSVLLLVNSSFPNNQELSNSVFTESPTPISALTRPRVHFHQLQSVPTFLGLLVHLAWLRPSPQKGLLLPGNATLE